VIVPGESSAEAEVRAFVDGHVSDPLLRRQVVLLDNEYTEALARRQGPLAPQAGSARAMLAVPRGASHFYTGS